jgi:hypothetical protein
VTVPLSHGVTFLNRNLSNSSFTCLSLIPCVFMSIIDSIPLTVYVYLIGLLFVSLTTLLNLM